MRRLVFATLALAAVACGPPKPGPTPNTTYFWRVTSSTVAFNDNCSDDKDFRDANGPLKFESNSYVVYKASADAKKATLQSCTQLDPATCTPSKAGVEFDVAGAELSFATELKTPTGQGTCNVLDTQSWLLTDMVTTMSLDISDTLSLVDDDTTCATLEANAKARSTNGKGFQGCTITFTIGGSNR